jgi:polar amino acid transport system substrate-binding protein
MLRTFSAALALAAVLPVPTAQADLPEVLQRGTLRVLVMIDTRRPEFFTLDEAAPGFDREVLQGFAQLHHVKLEAVPVSGWDALIPALLEGKGDLIGGRFTVTESRKKLVAFTGEVFPTRNVVLTRHPHRVVKTVEELRAEKVGTIKGTSMAEAIAAAAVPPARVDDGIPPGGFAEALKSGRITAAVWGVESAIAAKRGDPAIQLGMFLGPPSSLAYAVRKGDTALLGALNEYISNLRRTPTWSRLVVDYFGADAIEVLKKARE